MNKKKCDARQRSCADRAFNEYSYIAAESHYNRLQRDNCESCKRGDADSCRVKWAVCRRYNETGEYHD